MESELRCPACGAARRPNVDRCWLCTQKFEREEAWAPLGLPGQPASHLPSVPPPELPPLLVPIEPHELPQPPAAATRVLQFSLSDLFMLITLVCVVCGMFALAPGLGIAIVFVLIPVAIRSYLVLRVRSRRGLATSRGQRWMMVLASTGVTILIIVAVQVAAIIGLVAACFAGIGASGFGQDEWFGPILIAGALLGIVSAAAVAFTIVRGRWESDTRR
jgi:hypothetical protein